MYTQQRPLTEQERIDQATMRIDNPNVAIVGSGFIQHPPQRPFERPLQVQPPTLSHLDFPDQYRNVPGLQPGVVPTAGAPAAGPPPGYAGGGGGRGAGAAAGAGRGGGGYSNGAPRGGYAGGRGGRGGHPAQQQQRPVYRQVPAELLRAPAPPPRPGAYPAAANGAAARPPAPRPVAPVAPRPVAPAPAPAAAEVPSSPRNEDGSKLSKAQKQRLRKKLREGK